MPVRLKKDSIGHYFQYGNTGKKYRFKTKIQLKKAYEKAIKQERAIHWNSLPLRLAKLVRNQHQ